MCLGNAWYVLAVLPPNPHLLPTCPVKFLDHHPHTQTLLLRPLRVHEYFNMCSQCLKFPHCSTINKRVVECCGVYRLLNSPCSCLSPFVASQVSFSESSHKHAPDFIFPTHIDTPKDHFQVSFFGERTASRKYIFFFCIVISQFVLKIDFLSWFFSYPQILPQIYTNA